MQMVQAADFQLRVLAAAVTPVVLVSAAAILVSTVNARYIAISDRMRSLAQEYRQPTADPRRRDVIASKSVSPCSCSSLGAAALGCTNRSRL